MAAILCRYHNHLNIKPLNKPSKGKNATEKALGANLMQKTPIFAFRPVFTVFTASVENPWQKTHVFKVSQIFTDKVKETMPPP
ncbi:MAG: hypothetical protein LUC23_06515 [Prevotellaceae bacterium]|nr:hypothetical protein [Prevotellaceae bacterium]